MAFTIQLCIKISNFFLPLSKAHSIPSVNNLPCAIFERMQHYGHGQIVKRFCIHCWKAKKINHETLASSALSQKFHPGWKLEFEEETIIQRVVFCYWQTNGKYFVLSLSDTPILQEKI